jgi:hypothetical protein
MAADLGSPRFRVSPKRFRMTKPRIGRVWPARAHHHQIDARLCQRVKIIEIGNAREGKAGDLDAARRGPGQIKRIFGGQQMGIGKPRHHAETAPSGACWQSLA